VHGDETVQVADGVALLLPRTLNCALAAFAAVSPDVGIRGLEQVAANAMSLCGIDGGNSITAKSIDAGRDGLKVTRCPAMAHSTKMIDLEPRRDRAGEPLVHQPVDPVELAIEFDVAVASGGLRAGPE